MTGLLASWAALDPGERKARLRALAALVRVFAGARADVLCDILRMAEDDAEYLADAADELAALPAIPMRKALSVMVRFCHGDGA